MEAITAAMEASDRLLPKVDRVPLHSRCRLCTWTSHGEQASSRRCNHLSCKHMKDTIITREQHDGHVANRGVFCQRALLQTIGRYGQHGSSACTDTARNNTSAR